MPLIYFLEGSHIYNKLKHDIVLELKLSSWCSTIYNIVARRSALIRVYYEKEFSRIYFANLEANGIFW